MPFNVFLNNQTILQALVLPNGQANDYPRYIFIEGLNVPIIFKDAILPPIFPPPPPAIEVNDGKNPPFLIEYEGSVAKVEVVLEVVPISGLQYSVTAGRNIVIKNL